MMIIIFWNTQLIFFFFTSKVLVLRNTLKGILYSDTPATDTDPIKVHWFGIRNDYLALI